MRKIMFFSLVLIMLSMLLGFTPAPVVQPGNPFDFDINACPSSPMLAVMIPVGHTYQGTLRVGEKDGDMVIVITNLIIVDPVPTTALDPTDPNGLAVMHTFNWSYTPTIAGLIYENVRVEDSYGLAGPDSIRTIVIKGVNNRPPIILECL